MDRADVISGAAFRAVLRSAVAFLLVLLVAGAYGVHLVDRMVMQEIRAHLLSVRVGLSEIVAAPDAGGLDARILQHLQRTLGDSDVYAVYGPNGALIDGNIDVPVADGAWVDAAAADGARSDYLLHGAQVGDYSVTIGRTTEIASLARQAAIRSFAITGFVSTPAMLAIGFWLSRDAQRHLERIERTLQRFATGESKARIPDDGQSGQISRISRRLNTELDRLDALMGATRRTAASVAHDLRRPLARLTLSQERALTLAEEGEDPRPEIVATLKGIGQLTEVVATIMRIARIEGGTVGAQERADLREVLDEIVETFAPVAEDTGGALAYARPEAPLPLRADGEMIAQMLVNLVQNALVHAGRGATIHLAGRGGEDAVVLEVADDGPGIPEAQRDEAFAPFFRADEARAVEGSGLGLALVKAIADRHGATVTLSDAGPGLRVTVRFPLDPASR